MKRIDPPRYLVLGQITRPHGVRGEVRLRLTTDYPERITTLDTVFLGKSVDDANSQPYRLRAVRMHQGYALLTFQEIPDRTAADNLRNLYVMVRHEDAVPLEDGEFYLYELIGLTVKTADDQILGTIKDVLETGANDVYVIHSPDYGEVLFPATEETIIAHDIPNGVVRVTIPNGLLPD